MTSPKSRPSPVARPQTAELAEVSYRLLREAAVKEARNNPLVREDFRDAHPMLLRAARSVGKPADGPCPLCEAERLVRVKYAFGPRLPAEGRCLESAADEERLKSRVGTFTCREVEVCCACSWNYQIRSYTVHGLDASNQARNTQARNI